MTLKFTPLGGLGEIGANCAVFEYKHKFLIFDCGVSFPDDDSFGVEAEVPDFQYIFDNADKVVALLCTHGHQDHIGAVAHLLADGDLHVPIYAPRLAIELISASLSEYGFDLRELDFIEIRGGDRIKIGPYDLEFVHMNHSIPDTLAVVFHTDVGAIVHSADFKLDPTPYRDEPWDRDRLKALGDEGVRLLFSDSTNAERPGHSGSESDVRKGLERVVRAAEGRVIVTMFSTNLYRVQSMLDIAVATGRKMCLLGRSLQKVAKIARDAGYLSVDADNVWIEPHEANRYHPDELIIGATGSQGQEKSALARMATGDLMGFRIEPGDAVVFSARVIPGNEHGVNRIKDAIIRRGGTIEEGPDLHVSGHAFRDEMRELLEILRPREFVPVHGEYRFQKAHAAIAAETGVKRSHVITNGDSIVIGKNTCEVRLGEISTRKVCVDRSPFAFADGEAMAKRKRLARGGLVAISLAISGQSGRLAGRINVQLHGLGDAVFFDDVTADVTRIVEDTVGRMHIDRRFDQGYVDETVRQTLGGFFKRELGLRPYFVTQVVRV